MIRFLIYTVTNYLLSLKVISLLTNMVPLPFQGLIGHRGVAGLAPENTLAGFHLAKKLGLSWVEFDVRPCFSGEWIIFHDEVLNRTTNGNGLVSQSNYSDIQLLDAGSWFDKSFHQERVPLLSTALTLLQTLGLHPNIEIKPFKKARRKRMAHFLTQLENHWPSSLPLPLVSSFDLELLRILRSLSPRLPLGYLVKQLSKTVIKEASEIPCQSIHCRDLIENEAFFQEAARNHLAVFVYTVNTWERADHLLQQGIHGVFSDLTHPLFVEKLKI